MKHNVALLSGVALLLGIAAWISVKNKKSRKLKLIQEIKDAINTSGQLVNQDDLVKEQLSRNVSFLGEKQEFVASSFVIIVGLGGVGSHAASMLLRSGVGKLRLIDFDQVSLSSLNRHAVATREDVGLSKVECIKAHFLKIFPMANIEILSEMFSKESASQHLSGNPDFVLDCIDNIHTKLDLLEYCHNSNIKVISSMGSGAKSDPTRIHIADITETFEDPLARATRKGLRMRGITSGITVVYSSEKPGNVKLLPLQEEQVQDANQLGVLPKFRARILPVLGPIPALFGMTMASFVLTEIAHWKTEPLAFKNRSSVYQRLHAQLSQHEFKKYGNRNIPLNIMDIGYIFEEIWRGRSALSGQFEKLVLVRWNPSNPPSFGNLICLTKNEAEKHEALSLDSWMENYPNEFLEFVSQRFEKEKIENEWRYYS